MRKGPWEPRAHSYRLSHSYAITHIECSLQSVATRVACVVNLNVNVNNSRAISIYDFDNSGEPGPQAKGVNHLETPLRHLHVTHRASSCAKRCGHVQLCSKPRGHAESNPRPSQVRQQLLSCPPTPGMNCGRVRDEKIRVLPKRIAGDLCTSEDADSQSRGCPDMQGGLRAWPIASQSRLVRFGHSTRAVIYCRCKGSKLCHTHTLHWARRGPGVDPRGWIQPSVTHG